MTHTEIGKNSTLHLGGILREAALRLRFSIPQISTKIEATVNSLRNAILILTKVL
jgi:hypothetical protein